MVPRLRVSRGSSAFARTRESLTNLFAWLQKGTPVRSIDGDERQPSRLAILLWSKADEVAAELEELTKSHLWVDELACTAEKRAPIQQVREFIVSLAHLHHADFDVRFMRKLTKRWPLRLLMICTVKCPARLKVVRSFLDEDETLLEITTLKFKSMFHTELQEVVLEQGERGRHTLGGPIFYMFTSGHWVCLELACNTNQLEVFHFFAPRHFANPWFVSVVSHVWILFQEYRSSWCACIVLVDTSQCCMFFGTPRLSSIRAGGRSLMRVFLLWETFRSLDSCSWQLWSVFCT